MPKLIISNTIIPAGVISFGSLIDNDKIVKLDFPLGKFTSENNDADLHNFIVNELNVKKYEAIFIPVFLGKSFTDYYGLRLGLHLRFTSNLNQFTPIIFYSSSNVEETSRFSLYKDILFQKGSYYCYLSRSEFFQFLNVGLPSITSSDVSEIAKVINIPYPKSMYNSNHSVANEWGIDRLASIAGIDSPTKGNNSIYFKWLKIANKTIELRTESIKIIEERSRTTKDFNMDDSAVEQVRFKQVLLVDDEAAKGWSIVLNEILKTKINIDFEKIKCATSKMEAIELSNKITFDLIFLDLRFGEEDHKNENIEKFKGFEILKEIRSDWNNLNFSTPIIVFTASNKIWNISTMLDAGADDYFIKEHPEMSSEKSFTKENYTRLLKNIKFYLRIGERKGKVKDKINCIELLQTNSILNNNIKSRISEKLKIGYGILFRKTNPFEKKKLLFNNEILAFIVFWSILEEISKDYYNRKIDTEVEWKLRKNNLKLQFEIPNKKVSSMFSNLLNDTVIGEIKPKTHQSCQVKLSHQIIGILRFHKELSIGDVKVKFNPLNTFRNQIDFIHSSTNAILTKKLSNLQDNEEVFNKCLLMLDFIEEILQ